MDPVETELLELEEQFWRASSTGDGSFYRSHVTDGALYVFPGSAGVLTKDECARVVSGNHTPWAWFRIEQPRFVRFLDDLRLLTYTSRARPEGGAEFGMRVTTVYSREPEGWKLAFHQQTMAE